MAFQNVMSFKPPRSVVVGIQLFKTGKYFQRQTQQWLLKISYPHNKLTRIV